MQYYTYLSWIRMRAVGTGQILPPLPRKLKTRHMAGFFAPLNLSLSVCFKLPLWLVPE